jgi:hypothetical protein
MALGDTHAGGGVGTGEWAQGAGGNWSGSGDWGAVSNPGNYSGTWGSQGGYWNDILGTFDPTLNYNPYDNPAYFGGGFIGSPGSNINSGAMNYAGTGQGAVNTPAPAPAPMPAAPAPAAPAAPAPVPGYMQPGNPAAYAQAPAWNLNLTDFSGGGGGGPLAPSPWQAPGQGGAGLNWQAPAGLLGKV